MQADPFALGTAQAERAAVAVGIRQHLHATDHAVQILLGPQATHQAEGALGHAVVGAVERQHLTTPGGRAYQLQGRLHCIGAGRPAELDTRIAGELGRQAGEQLVDEVVLGFGHQVQRMQRSPAIEQAANGLQHDGMVVPQRQGAGAGQAIDEPAALAILHVDTLGAAQLQRDAPGITARVGLHLALVLQPGRAGEAVVGATQRRLRA